MPNPFLLSILTLITTLATTPTIANTDLLLAVASAGVSGDAATQTT
jgi:hypothetical protein